MTASGDLALTDGSPCPDCGGRLMYRHGSGVNPPPGLDCFACGWSQDYFREQQSREHDMTETDPPADLAGHDRRTVARARELIVVAGADAVRERTGEADIAIAYACAWGEAREVIAGLLAIIGRLDLMLALARGSREREAPDGPQ